MKSKQNNWSVAEVVAENGKPVQFGQVLFKGPMSIRQILNCRAGASLPKRVSKPASAALALQLLMFEKSTYCQSCEIALR